jgi:hypothetical protein
MKVPHRRVRTCALLTLGSLLFLAQPARPWGHRGHELVNAAAVENLPEPLRNYFLPHKDYLVAHASDPDLVAREDARERSHHYTEVEAYDAYPFDEFKKEFVQQHLPPTLAQLRHGDSVWQIDLYAQRLRDAFLRRRWTEVDRDSVFLAHYACDLTQPLHTVLNYDGQLTHQAGVHARFESELVNALADRWVLHPQSAAAETDLRARIFSEYLTSYQNRFLVFAGDHIAVEGRRYTDPRYMLTFEDLLGLMARKRLEAASAFVSTLWYTAWVRAGNPDLRAWTSTQRAAGAGLQLSGVARGRGPS